MVCANDKSSYFIGPLNLNRQTKQADTAIGKPLSINDREFDALDMLALRESEVFSFEQLYSAVWEKSGCKLDRATALSELIHLMEQVSLAGDGFMWIEHKPDAGYAFRTRWAHNWRAESLSPHVRQMTNENG